MAQRVLTVNFSKFDRNTCQTENFSLKSASLGLSSKTDAAPSRWHLPMGLIIGLLCLKCSKTVLSSSKSQAISHAHDACIPHLSVCLLEHKACMMQDVWYRMYDTGLYDTGHLSQLGPIHVLTLNKEWKRSAYQRMSPGKTSQPRCNSRLTTSAENPISPLCITHCSMVGRLSSVCETMPLLYI